MLACGPGWQQVADILLRLVVQLLGFRLQLFEASLGIDVHGILRDLALGNTSE